MTEEKTKIVLYLDKKDIKIIHSNLRKKSLDEEEPIPPLNNSNIRSLDHIINVPKVAFFGKELYPSIEEKASILFYVIIKNHFFTNGNKRMSIYCLMAFLRKNGKDLKVSQDNLSDKAIEIAKAESSNFNDIKVDIKNWIEINIVDLDKTLDWLYSDYKKRK